jgi:diadenosine tetraphosphatase ApaH/serine/threonine PP2A family protein phosphatase
MSERYNITEDLKIDYSLKNYLDKMNEYSNIAYVPVLNMYGRSIVVGDLHGSLESLLGILFMYGPPIGFNYIFLGDYVDRGLNSVEVLYIVISLKLKYSKNVVLLRGNHETEKSVKEYGLLEEVKRKYPEDYLEILTAQIGAFTSMPLCCILDDKIFLVHGGISSKFASISDIVVLKERFKDIDPIKDVIVNDLLWSDPGDYVGKDEESNRGENCILFGRRTLERFLFGNSLELLVRGHECYEFKDRFKFGGRLVTVFSCNDYDGSKYDGYVMIIDRGIKFVFIEREY